MITQQLGESQRELAESQKAVAGLRQQNAAIAELSQMRTALEQERAANLQMWQMLAQVQQASPANTPSRGTQSVQADDVGQWEE